MNARTRRGSLALALACLLCLPSCVTAALWEGAGCRAGWSDGEVAGRVLLTPFTLLLDAMLIGAEVCAHGCAHGCAHR
jgi:fatty acid desaturase